MAKMKKAARELTRQHNKRLILKTIYEHSTISRAELARITGLTRPTVSELVALLLEEGITEEVGLGPSVGGKPPTLLRIVDDHKLLIGVDLSKRDFQGCLMNLRGEILYRTSFSLNNNTGAEALQIVYELIDELVDKSHKPLLGIGIGTPGSIHAQQGVIRSAINLGWFDLPLIELLASRYNVPIYLANDSQMAALAEFTFGKKQREINNLVVLKAGRGISAGIVINGRLYFGEGFGASEIGHVRAVENGKKCACGHYGCLETVVSSRVIVEKAFSLARDHPQSSLAERFAETGEINIRDVTHAYQMGDSYLAELVRETGIYLGIAIAHLVSALIVKNVILAGSVSEFGEDLRDIIVHEVRERSLPTISNDTSIELSTLGEDIVIKGATAILLADELGIA